MHYFEIKGMHFHEGKYLIVRIYNTTDNILRVRNAYLYAILPQPIEVRYFFGLFKSRTSEVLIGLKKGLSEELKPNEEYNIVIEFPKPIQYIEELLRSKYGWEGLCKLNFKCELVVGYARTLLESRAEVRKEFKAEVLFRIKDQNIFEVSNPRFTIVS